MPTPSQLESIEARAWADLFRTCRFNVVEENGVTVLRAPGFPNPDMNRAIGLGSVAPATEALLDDTIAEFSTEDPFYLQVVPESNPPELHDWIRARGFTARRRWVKLWRPLTSAPDFESLRTQNPRIERVLAAEAERWAATICEGFGLPVELAELFEPLGDAEYWRAYLAYLDDQIAGAALMHLSYPDEAGEREAALVMGCTLKPFRGRRVQGALLERRLADAYTNGARLAVCEAAEDIPEKPNPSLHNLIRVGFQEAYKRENYQKG